MYTSCSNHNYSLPTLGTLGIIHQPKKYTAKTYNYIQYYTTDALILHTPTAYVLVAKTITYAQLSLWSSVL